MIYRSSDACTNHENRISILENSSTNLQSAYAYTNDDGYASFLINDYPIIYSAFAQDTVDSHSIGAANRIFCLSSQSIDPSGRQSKWKIYAYDAGLTRVSDIKIMILYSN